MAVAVSVAVTVAAAVAAAVGVAIVAGADDLLPRSCGRARSDS